MTERERLIELLNDLTSTQYEGDKIIKTELYTAENGYGDFLDKIMDCDITEIPGADNLFQT